MMVTSNGIPGYRIDSVHGEVFASTIRPGSGSGLLRSFSGGGGGEGDQLRMVHQARQHAVNELWDACQRAGGNAVIGLRFDSSDMGQASEICAYGTAVRIVPVAEGEPGATSQSMADARGEGGPATIPTKWPTMGGGAGADFQTGERPGAGPAQAHAVQQQPPAQPPPVQQPPAQQPPAQPSPAQQPQQPPAQSSQQPVQPAPYGGLHGSQADAVPDPAGDSFSRSQSTPPSREGYPQQPGSPAGDQAEDRPRSPQQQRPNGDGSWLDL